MNKVFLEAHPQMPEDQHEVPVHASTKSGVAPLCGAEANMLWTSGEREFVDCPECLKELGD